VKDIFGVQDEISQTIVIAVKEILTANNGAP
jgi:TolB-like protein